MRVSLHNLQTVPIVDVSYKPESDGYLRLGLALPLHLFTVEVVELHITFQLSNQVDGSEAAEPVSAIESYLIP